MKNRVKLIRGLQIESSIVSWMFIGYFVLLAASAAILSKGVNTDETVTPTATSAAGGHHSPQMFSK